MNYTSKITDELNRYFNGYDHKLANSFIYNWESDFFCISKSNYAIEVEIKVSRSDFQADFRNKSDKHLRFKNACKEIITVPGDKHIDYFYSDEDQAKINAGESQWNFIKSIQIESNNVYFTKNIIPNKFYYCVPAGLIEKSEVPDYAGLLYYDVDKESMDSKFRLIKSAKFLHKRDYTPYIKDKLLNKYYYQNIELRNKIRDLKWQIHQISDVYCEPERAAELKKPEMIQGELF